MSNRSFPDDFYRPMREMPVATDEDVQRMLERLRRRCKAGKVSNISRDALSCEGPRATEETGNDRPGVPISDLAPAHSAGSHPPAGASVVSGAAEITPTAGGGPLGTGRLVSPPFQSTRPAPNNQGPSSGAACARGTESTVTLSSNQAESASSGTDQRAPMPRGSLPNSLGTSEEAHSGDRKMSGDNYQAPLQWERIRSDAMRTTCGSYTCSKVMVNGIVTYELWMRQAGLERPICIGKGIPDFESAKRMIVV